MIHSLPVLCRELHVFCVMYLAVAVMALAGPLNFGVQNFSENFRNTKFGAGPRLGVPIMGEFRGTNEIMSIHTSRVGNSQLSAGKWQVTLLNVFITIAHSLKIGDCYV